ncbi:MAG: PKD domain-containing protein [Candidatus Bipolaricaulota bacterium]
MVRLKRVGLIPVGAMVALVLLGGCFLLPNRPPVAAAAVNYNVDPEDPMVIELDASASDDPDGDAITMYMWAFSDDLALITPEAVTTSQISPILRVRCPVEGTYTAQLVVLDDHGNASSPLVGISIVVPHLPMEP